MAESVTFATQSANLVRQKAMQVCNTTGTRNPAVFYGLKALFLYLAQAGNPDLQYAVISGHATASDHGNDDDNVISAQACTLYAIYLRKTGSTATYFKITDHATTSTTDGTQAIGLKMTASGAEELHTYPNGKAFASGMTWTENTTGTAGTGNLLADRIDGFVILGA
jgi:hypothetical protein